MTKKQSRKGHRKTQAPGKLIRNRRARHDYELGDSLLAGIQLTGAETKSLRLGHGQLQGSYVSIVGDELFLLGATISGTSGIPISDQDKLRTRKLLAKRKEINQLITAKQQGRTIVPLEILTRGRYIKIRIAVGKGKKQYDKRQTLKKRDEERAIHAA